MISLNAEKKIRIKPKNRKVKKRKSLENKTNFMVEESNSCIDDSKETIVYNKRELPKKKKKKVKNSNDDYTLGSPSNNMQTTNVCIEEQDQYNTEVCDEVEPPKKKKKRFKFTDDEYKPGMLSNALQEKKYGRLILPWDPSFGLDPLYRSKISSQEENEQIPKLKINPLFDLSKRNDENSTSTDNVVSAVFVGNLPAAITISDVKKLFKKFGLIHHIKIRHKDLKFIKHKKRVNEKGVPRESKHVNAIVKFKSFESSKAALKLNGALYDGQHLRVTLTKEEGKADSSQSIFIGNLSFQTEDDDLWKHFEGCGEIESVRVIRDERTGIGKGFGYVNFKSEDSIEPALLLDGTTVLDRAIRVSRSKDDTGSMTSSTVVKRKKKKKLHPRGNPESRETKLKHRNSEILENITTGKTKKHKSNIVDNEQSINKPTDCGKVKKKKKKNKEIAASSL